MSFWEAQASVRKPEHIEAAALPGNSAKPNRAETHQELPMTIVSRRTVLLTPVAAMAVGDISAASRKMTLAIHQNTSAEAGYRKSLEGWARAGIKNVELTNTML